ncbi:urease accessory protein UreD [Metapseudomonas otitidis]|uniref:urease accessory protein UreD n=1 Tax=Metapseudomonas otitidis TaxID=319939 RepID=UPI0013F5C1A8|nr:urease accessory protein UreD [Pseudomonas otitidis]
MKLPATPFSPSWPAELELAHARRGERTIPVPGRHLGPLRVQKHLHAEGPEVCQLVIVHPPGGIDLHGDVRLLYWDIVALGRPAAGERFGDGHYQAALDIHCDGRGVLTQWPGLVLACCLGPEALQARAWLIELWRLLRPALLGREAKPPRTWST